MKNILIIGNSHIVSLFNARKLYDFKHIELEPIFLDLTFGKILPLGGSNNRLDDKNLK